VSGWRSPLLGRFHPRAGLVASRQRFVHCCHRAWTDISKSRQPARSSNASRASPLLGRLSRVRDLLLCAKHLFVAARTVRHRRQLSRGERDRVGCSSQCSLTGHLNCGVDGVFEIVRVVGRGFVSIAEVHAIVAGAHLAQGEPEMARDRFGFLERHGFLNRHREAVAVELPAKPRS
jgi:hypothetical protein